MRHPFLFAVLVFVVLAIAVGVFYVYIEPLVMSPSVTCTPTGYRHQGCQSDLGNALMYTAIVVAVIIVWLWGTLR